MDLNLGTHTDTSNLSALAWAAKPCYYNHPHAISTSANPQSGLSNPSITAPSALDFPPISIPVSLNSSTSVPARSLRLSKTVSYCISLTSTGTVTLLVLSWEESGLGGGRGESGFVHEGSEEGLDSLGRIGIYQ